MRRGASILAIAATALLAAAAPASAEFSLQDLGLSFSADPATGHPPTQAGSNPFAATFGIGLSTVVRAGTEVPEEEARDILTELPPGLLADPYAVPRCTATEFAEGGGAANCPDSSAVGVFDLVIGFGGPEEFKTPVFNLVAPPGAVLRLGIKPAGVPVTIDGFLNPDPPYNALASSRSIPQTLFFYRGDLSLWGNPVSSAHDGERADCILSGKQCPVSDSVSERPFIVLPRSCEGPLQLSFKARSWQHPETWVQPPPVLSAEEMVGCSRLDFAPRIDSRLSTDEASSPSGLAFDLEIADPGISSPEGLAASDIKKAVVTLPEGVRVNPSQAEGLATCSEADLAREAADSEPGEGCPEASKIGTVEVETPLLEGEILRGGLYVATPRENLAGDSLIALYMTIKSRELGVSIDLVGRVEPDPRTGQLITTFEDLPQAPFSHFRLRFREGGRSPLISPPVCGTHETVAEFTPWSDPDATHVETAEMEISEGPGGSPCPSGPPPFEPGFAAGSQNNAAGAFSPFAMRLTRRDGDADLVRFDATLPTGVSARLAGVSRCTEAQIARVAAKSGREELAAPSCPAGSHIGSVLAGAGVGSQLTYVPGEIYLAGPYGGAPLSAVAIVPAVAGPFDVGVVLTRQALRVDPRSGRVTADGALSDPIPHILEGIPLAVRDIQVRVERPGFALNPTGCAAKNSLAAIWGGGADPFSLADDSPVARLARYQAASCGELGFAPRLSLRLRGGTARGAHPALRGVYRPRAGGSNLRRLVLRLPRSAFLDQAHIRTICTRVQFKAPPGNGARCPKRAVYGRARAFTPLLAQPLEGPVFLRSSDNELPDMVAALHGAIEIEAVARIDSVRGGIRATFTGVPDAPISRVIVNMRGARKGLIVNSTDLCAKRRRANARAAAHNSKRAKIDPLVRPTGCRAEKRSAARRR